MSQPKASNQLALVFKLLPRADVARAAEIEASAYPESEAASLETLNYRHQAVPELFLGCYLQEAAQEQEKLVAFIVSTLVNGDHLTHSSMFSHEPQGSAVCIHSVCVDPAYHRRGIASRMLQSYTKHVQDLKARGHHLDTLPTLAAEMAEKEKKKENNNNNSQPSSSAHGNSFGQLDRVLLITHKELIGLYAGAGYQLIGPSKVEHGPDLWYEMVHIL
ncbi:guanine nucleotide exchange factor [Entomortierella parvispora]|uniref:Guanine nucleotide exchange factor n=1 Tax=Entomortierella parvispora TaxID=205924 RepID=A0A9P3HEG2_9FUNG|nr:guanine nucleotide exchange factor [Entomortierella parvispora]